MKPRKKAGEQLSKRTSKALPALPCLCANIRRAARALTQAYDEKLRPFGLRATQFTVLQALDLAGEISQGQLGRILAMDSTTLTRTLGILESYRWIGRRRGADHREWRLFLAGEGRRELQGATPAWELAQEEMRRKLGEKQWNEIMKLTREVANAIS